MTKYAKIRKDGVLLFKAEIADSFFKRLTGLIRKTKPQNQQGLLITRCKQVHTFFMSFPIDLVFLTKYHEVVGIEEDAAKNKISKRYKNAYFVLELAAGDAKRAGLSVGDLLSI